MTDGPKTPDAPNLGDAADEIVEVIFENHYTLAVLTFIAGALLVATIVYVIGHRNDVQEGSSEDA